MFLFKKMTLTMLCFKNKNMFMLNVGYFSEFGLKLV